MRSSILFGFLFLQFFCACNNSNDQSGDLPENDVDAGRMFIQAALNGDYTKARQLMIRDSLNNQYLDVAERNYQSRMNREDKRGYRESSINVHDVRQEGDSVSIISYSNSYKKQNDSLKVVRVNGRWLIDLKYSFPRSGSVQK
jgi:hypothetical protein